MKYLSARQQRFVLMLDFPKYLFDVYVDENQNNHVREHARTAFKSESQSRKYLFDSASCAFCLSTVVGRTFHSQST